VFYCPSVRIMLVGPANSEFRDQFGNIAKTRC